MEILSSNNPELILSSRINQFLAVPAKEQSFMVEYPFRQYYLSGEPSVNLLAVYSLSKSVEGDIRVQVAVTDQAEAVKSFAGEKGIKFDALADQFGLAAVDITAPLRLKTVTIAKPWGQEIWYTGIEERGQSAIVDARGQEIPLSWLFSCAPSRITNDREQSINLLKILDPLPEEVYGDLYFELHEEKREVYVVTHIDEQAWPAGEGAIRFGFNQLVRNQYDSDEAFRSAYLDAVSNYEDVRREIDGLFDDERKASDIAPNEAVSAGKLKLWQGRLPEKLQREEASRREAMNGFTEVKKLNLGDVVKVPCFTPHALQHGVRTVEFQTPVYERKILAFAQKVLTQDHWDTEEAVTMMSLDSPVEDELIVVSKDKNHQLETVVQFDDFEVFRLTLSAGCRWALQATEDYALVMKISGDANCDGVTLADEGAVFLPAMRGLTEIESSNNMDAVLLLAQPR